MGLLVVSDFNTPGQKTSDYNFPFLFSRKMDARKINITTGKI